MLREYLSTLENSAKQLLSKPVSIILLGNGAPGSDGRLRAVAIGHSNLPCAGQSIRQALGRIEAARTY